jgi:hypothetical protein
MAGTCIGGPDMIRLQENEPWRLSPSDLTFLYDECPRCFWLKVAQGFPRPRTPFPKVFTLLDAYTKDYFATKRTEEISPALPPGRVLCGDRWVRSRPLEVPGHPRPVQLRGRIDTALAFDDGSFGIIDFKTAVPKDHHVGFYGRQLHSYALAAENAARGSLELRSVSRIGLLSVEPLGMTEDGAGVAYYAEPRLIEVPRDDDAFLAFLSGVLFLLTHRDPPDPSPGCEFCRYVQAGAVSLLTNIYGDDSG